jgi:hypothetical protein
VGKESINESPGDQNEVRRSIERPDSAKVGRGRSRDADVDRVLLG